MTGINFINKMLGRIEEIESEISKISFNFNDAYDYALNHGQNNFELGSDDYVSKNMSNIDEFFSGFKCEMLSTPRFYTLKENEFRASSLCSEAEELCSNIGKEHYRINLEQKMLSFYLNDENLKNALIQAARNFEDMLTIFSSADFEYACIDEFGVIIYEMTGDDLLDSKDGRKVLFLMMRHISSKYLKLF